MVFQEIFHERELAHHFSAVLLRSRSFQVAGGRVLALLLFGVSMAGWVNGAAWGPYLFAVFGALLIYTLFGWFGQAARESEGGLYNQRVDISYRWSMSWFIFSEVMFFAAFFGALFYARVGLDALARRPGPQAFLWPDFAASWPNAGPAGTIEPFQIDRPLADPDDQHRAAADAPASR